jgi:hypothetical protein
MKSAGVVPEIIVGHSLGEIAASYCSGFFYVNVFIFSFFFLSPRIFVVGRCSPCLLQSYSYTIFREWERVFFFFGFIELLLFYRFMAAVKTDFNVLKGIVSKFDKVDVWIFTILIYI